MCDEKIEVSVWCLAFNHEKYIRKTLDGFVSQKTNFKFEVLVHDDASTDKTAQIIKEYATRYPDLIKPILQKENQYSLGINAFLEYFIPSASGEYYAFCEGDDYWTDEYKLQKQFDIMTKHSNVVLCVHKVPCINEDGTSNSAVYPPLKLNLNEDTKLSQQEFAELMYIKAGYCFHTSSYFMRKSIIEQVHYRKLKKKMNGDECMLKMSLKNGEVYYIDDAMSRRRLFSIGNWNNRFNAFDEEKKVAHYLNRVDAEVLFDEITKKKYHDILVLWCFDYLLSLRLRFKNNKLIKGRLIQFKQTNINEYRNNLNLRIRYFLIQNFTCFYKFLYQIKKGKNNETKS